VAFGMGGGLLQKLHRDTQKFAFKCSQAVIGKRAVDVFKCPVTDNCKTSKAGRLSLVPTKDIHGNPTVETVKGSEPDDLLVTVYENGEILKRWTLSEIRERAAL